jgi:deoxyribodipyrimidine photo-lyase
MSPEKSDLIFRTFDTLADRHQMKPTRESALNVLSDFISRAGHPYSLGRNFVADKNEISTVSKLSPYVRRRIITEHEIVSEVLKHHNLKEAHKFIQEILWRTYWKGWLEMRPAI